MSIITDIQKDLFPQVGVLSAASGAKVDNFEPSVGFTIPHEGTVFENDPLDPGGATKFGITLKELRDFASDPSLTADAVRALSLAAAKQIYRVDYWNKMKCDQLPVGVDFATFDFGVNTGQRHAIEFLQQAVGVTQDGVLGPITLAKIRTIDPCVIITHMTDEESAFYRSLPTFPRFGNGWLARTADRQAFALKMAHGA